MATKVKVVRVGANDNIKKKAVSAGDVIRITRGNMMGALALVRGVSQQNSKTVYEIQVFRPSERGELSESDFVPVDLPSLRY